MDTLSQILTLESLSGRYKFSPYLRKHLRLRKNRGATGAQLEVGTVWAIGVPAILGNSRKRSPAPGGASCPVLGSFYRALSRGEEAPRSTLASCGALE